MVLKDMILDAMELYVDKELDLGFGTEKMYKEKIGCFIKILVPL